ncbi:transcription antitermination factor NusB [Mycoplasma nasistruthionis]|uniref:Antitermination protein NusB n=1 Tax=Mycoplasma nasistruthionis TaxID=353852 RepID=A0A5B7XVT9_9MOLU|nr:transcription antitermination factor NusB [Mycoplasma nasistruthionis]QCZ36565.1 antitermination protein NusB [Mycoplasma nasistruthionis]
MHSERAKKSRRQVRIDIINVIYKYELLGKPIDLVEVFNENSDLTQRDLARIKNIKDNYDFFKDTILIKLFNTNWDWNRVSPLLRAILINGVEEFFTLHPKIVINEAIEITKLYFLVDTKEEIDLGWKTNESNYYKFINGILENAYKVLLKMERIDVENDN